MNKINPGTWLFFVFLLTLGGCKTSSQLTSFEDVLYPGGRFFNVKAVDENTRRGFEYLLLEGIRHKSLGDFRRAIVSYQQALSVDSTCATCHFEIGQILFFSGDTKSAEEHVFKAVQFDPTNEWFLSFLSRVYQTNNKPELALAAARYLVMQHPNSIDHLYNLAQFEYSQNLFSEAINTLNRIERLHGKSEFLSLEKHNTYMQKGELKSAKMELKELIKAFPGNFDYKVYLADFYTRQNKLEDAYNLYRLVITNDPGNGMAYFGLANYYLLKTDSISFKSNLLSGFASTGVDLENKLQRLVQFLVSIDDPSSPLKEGDFDNIFKVLTTTHPFDDRVHLLQASYFNHKGLHAQALVAFESSLLLNKTQVEVWHDFLSLSLKVDTREQFLERCISALAVYPEDPLIHYFTGVAYSLNDNRIEAIQHLNEVIRLNKDNPRLDAQVFGFLGDLHFKEGNPELSFEFYQKSLAIDDTQISVLNNYAYYLSLMELNLDKAERMISKVIEIEPKNPTFLDTYAWVLFKRQRYFEALFIIEQAISYNGSTNGVILEHYGDILYKNGNHEKALEMWIKAVETNDKDLTEHIHRKISEKTYIR